jgi:hypothetical protein
MIDIKLIRNSQTDFELAMQSRGLKIDSQKILQLDEKNRKKTQLIQDLQAKRNKLAQDIAILKRSNSDATALMDQSKETNHQLLIEEQDFNTDEELQNILLNIPNIPAQDVKVGIDENDNVEIEKFGEPKKFDFTPKSHDELGEALKMLDFEQSAQMSGARFSTLSGDLAKLERVIANSDGVSYPAISSTKLGDMKIILPPKEEQELISKYLEDRTTAIDKLIKNIDAQIEKLQEVRKIKIYEAVTGKIKVNAYVEATA